MVEISIIGATITGNRGSESMYQSAIQNISVIYPDAIFNLFTYYPKKDRINNKNDNVRILSGTPLNLAFVITPLSIIYRILHMFRLPTTILEKNEDIHSLVKSDLIIDMAGISFVDGREKYLPFNVACVTAPLMMKKKVMKYSQAMGPFNNTFNRLLAKLILPRLNVIVARGEITKSNLETLNLKNVVLGADAAFSMNVNNDIDKNIKEYLRDDLFEKTVLGVSPSSVIESYCDKNNLDYVKIMAEFINYIIEVKDINVIILPHSVRKYSKKRKNNDLIVSRSIHNQIKNKDKCILIPDELTAEELRAIISRCDLFFASRFHAMISALSMRVPTLVCGWSHKYLEVLSMFQLEEYAFDYKNLDIDVLIKNFENMLEQKEIIRGKLELSLPDVIASSKKNDEVVKNLLEV